MWEIVRWTAFGMVVGTIFVIVRVDDPTLKQWILWEIVWFTLGVFTGIVWVRGWKDFYQGRHRQRGQGSDGEEPDS